MELQLENQLVKLIMQQPTIDNYSKQIPQFFSGMQNFNQNNPYYQ